MNEIKIPCPKCGMLTSNGNKCLRCGTVVNSCKECSGNCLKCSTTVKDNSFSK